MGRYGDKRTFRDDLKKAHVKMPAHIKLGGGLGEQNQLRIHLIGGGSRDRREEVADRVHWQASPDGEVSELGMEQSGKVQCNDTRRQGCDSYGVGAQYRAGDDTGVGVAPWR